MRGETPRAMQTNGVKGMSATYSGLLAETDFSLTLSSSGGVGGSGVTSEMRQKLCSSETK
ncbi:hypothetical protein Hamer_G018080 [Homarus americanus]|uniref:Uncharacterized protein n=1 Tax=Homarus americanus TaxID=6706 RepID=A0A8J5TI15_HOMAM|nr:hypothetical protein Hamer_G018080 [Homarus americanus]